MVVEKNVRITEHFFDNRYIWKQQLVLVLWERLPAAIVLIRGWKPLPQESFFCNLGIPDKRKDLYRRETRGNRKKYSQILLTTVSRYQFANLQNRRISPCLTDYDPIHFGVCFLLQQANDALSGPTAFRCVGLI